MNKPIRKCLSCGKKIIGRSDKKFCDALCRNDYNNLIKRDSEKLIIKTNSILRKNRTILKQFNPEGKTTIRTEYLHKLGFDFRYFTHTFTSKKNNEYHFCYEYGYLNIDDEKTLIVNWQPYMEQ